MTYSTVRLRVIYRLLTIDARLLSDVQIHIGALLVDWWSARRWHTDRQTDGQHGHICRTDCVCWTSELAAGHKTTCWDRRLRAVNGVIWCRNYGLRTRSVAAISVDVSCLCRGTERCLMNGAPSKEWMKLIMFKRAGTSLSHQASALSAAYPAAVCLNPPKFWRLAIRSGNGETIYSADDTTVCENLYSPQMVAEEKKFISRNYV